MPKSITEVQEIRNIIQDYIKYYKLISTDVKTYGAKGDGTTDDTTAINAAIAAGNYIFFPEGNYIYQGTTLSADKIFIGDKSKITFKSTVASGYMFNCGNYTVEFLNLILYGGEDTSKYGQASPTNTRSAIYYNSQTKSKIHNCKIYGFEDYAIYMTGSADTSTALHSRISDCEIWNCHQGIYGEVGNTEYLGITNCSIMYCRYGINAESGNITIDSCLIEKNGWGIYMDGTGDTNNGHGRISNCTLNHNSIPFYFKNITLGELILGCVAFYGDLYLNTCTGIYFIGGQYDLDSFNFTNGGFNLFKDIYSYHYALGSGPANTIYHSGDKTEIWNLGSYTNAKQYEFDAHKIIITSHDVSVTGTQTITGIGFNPTFFEVSGVINNVAGQYCDGWYDGYNQEVIEAFDTQTAHAKYNSTGYVILIIQDADGSVYARATVTSRDYDSITITWDKGGSPTGTMNLIFRFHR